MQGKWEGIYLNSQLPVPPVNNIENNVAIFQIKSLKLSNWKISWKNKNGG